MAANEIKLIPTTLQHVFKCDIHDSGILSEILVVKKFNDGSIYYVEIEPLHSIDKSRIKKIVTSQHADKYECWDLLSMAKLSNGMNALDYFHSNNVKVKRPKGAASSVSGLEAFQAYGSDQMIGSDNSNPAEANLDQASKMFNVQ